MKKANIKISVIIPIYKTEQYLAECVESVLNQTYPNIEILLVNDGSPDGCPQICDSYAQQFERVKAVHKENGGLSDARNYGIYQATGDYCIFLDSDDYWDDVEAVAKLVDRIEKTGADVLNYSYKKYYEDIRQMENYMSNGADMPLDIKEKGEQMEYLMSRHLYIASACNKLVKRSLFQKELFFEKGVYSEDIEWCAKLLLYAESFDYMDYAFYCYRQRKDSISHSINDKKCMDLCNNICACLKLWQQASGAEKDALAAYTAFQYGTFIKVQALAEHKQTECIQRLKEHQHILSHHKGNKKVRLLHLACRMMGYVNLCKIIRLKFHR